MTELLEAAQPVEDDGVTDVEVGTGGIEAELHPQRPLGREEHAAQRIGVDHLGDAIGEQMLDG